MNNRECFLKTLVGEKTDRVPIYDYIYHRGLFEAMLGRRPVSYTYSDLVDCAKAMGFGMAHCAPESVTPVEPVLSDDNTYTSGGTTFKRDPNTWPYDAPIAFPIKTRDDFNKFTAPVVFADDSPEIQGLKNLIKRANGEIAISGSAGGPLTQVWYWMGPEEMFVNMYDEPELMRDVFRMSTDSAVGNIKAQIKAGVDMIVIAEDLGSCTAPFISYDLFRQFILPGLKEMADVVKQSNLPLMLHCDGNVNTLIDDFIAIGVDGLHPIQKNAGMDLRRIKEKYGDRLTLIGNVSSIGALVNGTEDDVEREVRECLEIAKPGGRYVLASDHSLNENIPLKNIFRMFETAKKYGKY